MNPPILVQFTVCVRLAPDTALGCGQAQDLFHTGFMSPLIQILYKYKLLWHEK